MAISFPSPANDGQVFVDPSSGNSWIYEAATDSWTGQGVNAGGVSYRGAIEILRSPAAQGITPQAGFLYTVSDGGLANVAYVGLSGQQIAQGSSVVFDGAEWQQLNTSSTSPFLRTVGGVIEPVNAGDDLDMGSGSYLIESLTDLP